MFGRRPQGSASRAPVAQTPWSRYWGESYGPDLKKWLLKPVFEEFEKGDRIGNLIVDVGSGAVPVSQILERRPGRKRILVDIAAEEGGTEDAVRVRLDVEKVGRVNSMSFAKALVKAARFLKTAPAAPVYADTIIFSDLLNYVDFRAVLGGFSRYLKPGGRLLVVNLPIRGNQSLFSDHGLKDNRQLYQFLEEQRFEIEHKSFPCRPRGESDESEELIVLVVRKPLGLD